MVGESGGGSCPQCVSRVHYGESQQAVMSTLCLQKFNLISEHKTELLSARPDLTWP